MNARGRWVSIVAALAGCGLLLATQVRSADAAPQRFDMNTPLAIPDARDDPALSTIPVAILDRNQPITRVAVSLHISHPVAGHLLISLVGPDGTTVRLSNWNGGVDRDYGTSCASEAERTVFADTASAPPITAARAPFVGTFRPEESLSTFNGKAGAALNGTWTLRVEDQLDDPNESSKGILACWSLFIEADQTDASATITGSAVTTGQGETVTYMSTATNNGPSTLYYLALLLTVPAETTVVSAAPAACQQDTATATVFCLWDETIAPGQARTATMQLRVKDDVPNGTRFEVTASVGTSIPDQRTANDQATAAVTVVALPTVTAVSPAAGPPWGGTTVRITGTNFSTAPGGTQVRFGGTAAGSVMCASTTTCTVVAPPGAGVVDVMVSVAEHTSRPLPSARYTYVLVPDATAMTVSGVVIGGLLAPSVSEVRALVGSIPCGAAPTRADGSFALAVFAASQVMGCGTNGATVSFTIDGHPAAATAAFVMGGSITVKLAIVDGGSPTPMSTPALTTMTIAGTATAGGVPVPPGVAVEAFAGGVLCGRATTGSGGTFTLVVASAAQTPGCGVNGTPIGFRINGTAAVPEVPFTSGATVTVALKAAP